MKYKKITKQGRLWIQCAIKDMKRRTRLYKKLPKLKHRKTKKKKYRKTKKKKYRKTKKKKYRKTKKKK